MKVLITVGAGFLGLHLTHYFHKKKWEIRILDIADLPYEEYPKNIEFIQGDIRSRADVAKAVEGVDVVIHAAAALPLRSAKEIMATNVTGTGNVMEESLINKIVRV